MDYKLALELKKAGFPQKDKGTLLFAEGITLADSQKKWDKNSVYAPTLSELIEACEHFRLLEKEIGYWRACGWKINLKDSIEEHGRTPEEAVACLFISLQEKG